MSVAQNLDPEMIPEIQAKRERIREAFGPMKQVFENSIDLAHKNNIPVLERECQNGLEGAIALTKLADELDESLQKLVDYLQNLADAVN